MSPALRPGREAALPLPRRVLVFLRAHRPGMFGGGVLAFFVLVGVLAPLIAPHSAVGASGAVFAPPSSSHWLGCDDGGVDILSQLLGGGRVSLLVGFAAAAVALVIGGGVGVVAGYLGGRADSALMRATDYFLVVPSLVLMIVIADLWGTSLLHVILVIGLVLWASTARVIRAQTKSVRERVYVTRARTLGAGDLRILFLHVLPQLIPLLIANTVLTIAVGIFDESALAFLGLSDPTQVTWGKMISFAYSQGAVSVGAWWTIVPPGVCIALVVIGCYLTAQEVERALRPQHRTMHFVTGGYRVRSLAPVVPVVAGPGGRPPSPDGDGSDGDGSDGDGSDGGAGR